MNDRNHTNRGDYESQTPDNNEIHGHSQGALWNSPIGRRVFLKKTGAATVATAVAVHGFRVQVQAEETGDVKTRAWDCRRTIWGPRATPYTAAELADAEAWWNDRNPTFWVAPPSGPPTGATLVAGPYVVAMWAFGRPAHWQLETYRNPERPTATNVVIGGQNYAVFEYQYVENEFEVDPAGP